MTGQHGEQTQWNIYHRDREYAQYLNDPVVAVVTAGSKEKAERQASQRLSLPSGAWAVEERRKTHELSYEMEL